MNPPTAATTMQTFPGVQQEHSFHNTNGAGDGSDREDAGSDIDNQKAPRRFFRRPRAGRACGTCHSRRVRCDAGSHGLPCTNCAAFSLECSIPPRKKKRREGDTVGALKRRKQRSRPVEEMQGDRHDGDLSAVSSLDDFATVVLEADRHLKEQIEDDKTYVKILKPEHQEETKFEIEDPGRVSYMEEFSNMSILVQEYQGPAGVHYPLPKLDKDPAVSTRMNDVELEILQTRGALSLPPKELCDELIREYFKWIAPVVPVINKTLFMQRYHDPKNPPSLLLMQAILLAGSRVCATTMLLDSNGSEVPAATLFYQRAKALYDADYEKDRVTLVQALILMGWYWEDPGRVPKNVFYWNGLATTVAHGCGMHRSTKSSRLSLKDQRLWTRIWWTLYTRDRSVAAALGRPTHISLEGSDVEMVCEDDFIEDGNVPPNAIHVQFFLQYVKICEIMDLVLFQNYSISRKAQSHNAMALARCDLALAEWLHHLSLTELRWEHSRYNFWSAYLQIVYNTTSCLLHRAHLPPTPSPPLCTILTQSPAFQAAHAITSITQDLIAHNDLRHTPPFIIYSLLSALMVHIYHLHTAMPSEVLAQRESILLCMDALERVSELWLVGKMVRDLFEKVLAFDGFDFRLTHTSSHGSTQKLKGTESELDELNTTDGSTPESLGSDKSLKLLPLTPSLVAHMDAALKSAATPSQFEQPSNPRSTSEGILLSQTKQELWQYPRPLSPRRRSEYHGIHNPTWMDFENPSSPRSTGHNAVEWFQFFGIQ